MIDFLAFLDDPVVAGTGVGAGGFALAVVLLRYKVGVLEAWRKETVDPFLAVQPVAVVKLEKDDERILDAINAVGTRVEGVRGEVKETRDDLCERIETLEGTVGDLRDRVGRVEGQLGPRRRGGES